MVFKEIKEAYTKLKKRSKDELKGVTSLSELGGTIRVAYKKRKLLIEESKKEAKDRVRRKKLESEKRLSNLEELENELDRRLSKEKTRQLTKSDKIRIKERKKLITQRKSEVKEGLKNLGREAKNIFIYFGEQMDQAQKDRENRIKAMKKKQKPIKKKSVKKVSKKKSNKKKKK